jgi:pimeloyl-ACP methyl ester carboxylesterase
MGPAGYGERAVEGEGAVSEAYNGDVEIHYEAFGAADTALVLVNGLGSQCINYPVEWCELFAGEGYRTIRMDNRDVGLSSKVEERYSLADMAEDVVAVLDAEGIDRSHVMGLSMGGMIVQRLAIDHPDRLVTMTSVMSRTGEPGFGDSTPEALAFLTAAPATSRQAYIDNHVAAIAVFGSKPEWIDDEETRARAAAAYDRCFHPAGIARQMAAIGRDGSRDEELRAVTVPTLVMHGSRDTLIQPSGGRHTAEVIANAHYVEIEGMGHDYPRAVWKQWVRLWSDFASGTCEE